LTEAELETVREAKQLLEDPQYLNDRAYFRHRKPWDQLEPKQKQNMRIAILLDATSGRLDTPEELRREREQEEEVWSQIHRWLQLEAVPDQSETWVAKVHRRLSREVKWVGWQTEELKTVIEDGLPDRPDVGIWLWRGYFRRLSTEADQAAAIDLCFRIYAAWLALNGTSSEDVDTQTIGKLWPLPMHLGSELRRPYLRIHAVEEALRLLHSTGPAEQAAGLVFLWTGDMAAHDASREVLQQMLHNEGAVPEVFWGRVFRDPSKVLRLLLEMPPAHGKVRVARQITVGLAGSRLAECGKVLRESADPQMLKLADELERTK
jgi:hypothetical protein